VDAVLSAIVRRVRQLLGADLGYLSLIDVERGDCYMRITEGSQSPAFPTLRLPLGSGVVGRTRSGVRPPKPVTCRYLSRPKNGTMWNAAQMFMSTIPAVPAVPHWSGADPESRGWPCG
jgi:hypothetical protein